MKENKGKYILNVIIIILFFVGIIFLSLNNKTERTVNTATDNNSENYIQEQNQNIMGNPNARLKIVEYTDPDCPFCQRFHNTMLQLIEHYKGEIAWEYKHYPIPELHPEAFEKSLALECAKEQGGNLMFWKFTNELYKLNMTKELTKINLIEEVSKNLKINSSDILKCVEEGRYAQKVVLDMQEGNNLKVEGTPTSFIYIDGNIVEQIPGAQEFNTIKSRIDLLLAD